LVVADHSSSGPVVCPDSSAGDVADGGALLAHSSSSLELLAPGGNMGMLLQ